VNDQEGWPDLYTPYTNINEAEASCGSRPASCSFGIWGYFPGNEVTKAWN